MTAEISCEGVAAAPVRPPPNGVFGASPERSFRARSSKLRLRECSVNRVLAVRAVEAAFSCRGGLVRKWTKFQGLLERPRRYPASVTSTAPKPSSGRSMKDLRFDHGLAGRSIRAHAWWQPIVGLSGKDHRERRDSVPHVRYDRAHSDPDARPPAVHGIAPQQRNECAVTRWPQWFWSVTRLVLLDQGVDLGARIRYRSSGLRKRSRDGPAARGCPQRGASRPPGYGARPRRG
jgi:hypothetical protein